MELPLKRSSEAVDWLAAALGAAPSAIHVAPMHGSTSSSVYRVRAGQREAVLRVLDNAPWLAEEPDLAAHEAAALEEAARAGLAAPRLIAYADEAGFGAPVVLMSLVEGEVVLRPPLRGAWLHELAITLAAIHRHPAEGFPWQYRSWVAAEAVAIPAWSAQPDLWASAIALWQRGAPDDPATFIHRDYHPTNVLWRGDAVSGVVDWINACRGPAGVDVAHCRVNLALMAGPADAAAFLDAYCAAVPGYCHDPYWDVESLMDMGNGTPTFYPPWATFGLPVIPAATLQRRADAYLGEVMGRIGSNR